MVLNDIISYIENVTNIECVNRSWQDIVDNVILPHMAGGEGTDKIDDKFMNFLAEYPQEIYEKDSELASILMEIALRRLSAGAVLQSRVPAILDLPAKYNLFLTGKLEDYIMTNGCLNFIMKAFPQCLHDSKVRDHTEVIVFGLISHLTADGKISPAYKNFNHNEATAAKVYHAMENLANRCFDYNKLFNEYARPQEWRKHIEFFSMNYYLVDWKKFFERTGIGNGNNFLSNLYNRQAVKKEIKDYCNSLGRHH